MSKIQGTSSSSIRLEMSSSQHYKKRKVQEENDGNNHIATRTDARGLCSMKTRIVALEKENQVLKTRIQQLKDANQKLWSDNHHWKVKSQEAERQVEVIQKVFHTAAQRIKDGQESPRDVLSLAIVELKKEVNTLEQQQPGTATATVSHNVWTTKEV